ncbi:carbamoyl-phosphate synthase large subunit, partial [Klebsiella pneumoniae]
VSGFDEKVEAGATNVKETILKELKVPGPERIWYVADAFRHGFSLDDVFEATKIDRWFLIQIQDIVNTEAQVKTLGFGDLTAENIRSFKRKGLSDLRIANLMGISQKQFRKQRWNLGVYPVYKRVDTCAAEFESGTAYMYSTYDEECEANPSNRDKIMVIGGGPNRIGQ